MPIIFFSLPAVAGVLLGLLSGGRVSNLGQIKLKRVWLLMGAVAAQLPFIYLPAVPPDQGLDPLRIVLPVALAVIALFAVLNARVPGMPLVLAGTLCNLLAVSANGGLMPIEQSALIATGRPQGLDLSLANPGIRLPRSKDVVQAWDQTRLPWLTDVIVTPPLPRRMAASVGDLIIAAGIAYLTAEAVRSSSQEQEGVSGDPDPATSRAAAAPPMD